MFVAAVETSTDPGDPLAGVVAISALLVSLLAAILPAATGRQQRLRDDRAKRSEMYLELMELVERHGLWVVDRTYDLVETSDDASAPIGLRRGGRDPWVAKITP